MPNPSKVYVLAANARIADMVARGIEGVERQSDYVYVHSPEQCDGVLKPEVYIYYGGCEHGDYDRIHHLERRLFWRGATFHSVAESDLR